MTKMRSPTNPGLPRTIEVALALAALMLLLPLLAAVGLAVAVSSPGPIIFHQRRMGRGGRPFEILKFRTMRQANAGPAVTAKGDPRITPVGRILRKTKVDELPELWNIVRGDMSLVGPRPEAIQYVDLSSEMWQDVLRVRPGITDPVTLRLRNEEELLGAVDIDHEAFYRERLVPYKLSGYRDYIEHRTWRRDLRVLWLTLLAIALPHRVPPPSLDEIAGYAEFV
jgi:lipopolysaccharide/colanic/teichoic acid biosynthesis glycosyltransferase